MSPIRLLILKGHLYLSGMWLGGASKTDTTKDTYVLKDWAAYLNMKVALGSTTNISGRTCMIV